MSAARPDTGCLVCGGPVSYLPAEREQVCSFCGGRQVSAMVCAGAGHFVCDGCHGAGAIDAIERICVASRETDMPRLLALARSHPSVAMHGPEHHALVAGVVLACCRNAGFAIEDDRIRAAIRRGGKHPGGACGYLGTCGAAVGMGAAFSVALDATPTKGPLRGEVIRAVSEALARIGATDGARCCQRDCLLALEVAAGLAPRLLGVRPVSGERPVCTQFPLNDECADTDCPFHPAAAGPR